MIGHQPSPFPNLLSMALAFGIAIVVATPPSSQAQMSRSDSSQTGWNFDPPPEEGEPMSTAGGGSRSDDICLQEDQLTLLTSAAKLELTDSDRLTLSIPLPETSAASVFISVEDEDKKLLYYETLPLEETPGTLSLSWPKIDPSLESRKTYNWSLSVICGEELDPNDPTIEGWLQPMESESL